MTIVLQLLFLPLPVQKVDEVSSILPFPVVLAAVVLPAGFCGGLKSFVALKRRGGVDLEPSLVVIALRSARVVASLRAGGFVPPRFGAVVWPRGGAVVSSDFLPSPPRGGAVVFTSPLPLRGGAVVWPPRGGAVVALRGGAVVLQASAGPWMCRNNGVSQHLP